MDQESATLSRRQLLAMIGRVAGAAVMYEAISELALAGESGFTGPIELRGAPRGASVLVLGAGLAGLSAAYELRKAGYLVQILEYNTRAGGRTWSLRGGDTYTELGGLTQQVEFDRGQYFNPGPWRIPYHHEALLHYCRLFNVPLESFCQVNYNAYVHSVKAFDGKPQRFRQVHADFNGHVADLLSKCVNQGALDQPVTRQDRETLLEAMRDWGALDKSYQYKKGLLTSNRRGFASDPGGGLVSAPIASEPLALTDLLQSRLWSAIATGHNYEFQSMVFQPVGGMDAISEAFGREVGDLIRYNAKVTEIRQDENGVNWCICTIPASVLGQIPMNVGAPLRSAIDALYYGSSVKVGLQFRRRFWEQDEAIYGGITYTDLPNAMIGYPSTGYFAQKGVLLGAYAFGPSAFELTSMTPQDRVKKAVEYGARIHPQYEKEFECGVSVAWHRVPWTLGCVAIWTDALRAQHYNNLCSFDGRIVLAGEHASQLPAWQEGALLSSLDAIGRLHQRVMQGVV